MALSKRIIPCLDIKNGRTVKGTNFVDLKDAGDPVELAHKYAQEGADELVLLDITASYEKRDILLDVVKNVAKTINIPFSVGGGIKSIQDVENLLKAGAEKISINTSAIKNPHLINELSTHFGSQCIILAVDGKSIANNVWNVFMEGGRKDSGKELISWIKEAEDRGVGEILFTSMDHDGTKTGYALECLKTITSTVNVPVIASGGAGKLKDFEDVFMLTNADAALAASLFHFKEITIPQLKQYLIQKNIPIRWPL